jgi:c-di-GMP-binding flagellar brake protein YcgR
MRGFLVSIIFVIIFSVTAILLWLHEKKSTDEIVAKLDSYYNKLQERRKAIRFDTKLNVVCKVAEKTNNHWSIYSKDISGEGVCLYLPEILPNDAVVDLVIDVPGKRKISVTGKVAWVKEIECSKLDGSRQFSAGVRFIKIKPKAKLDLVNFVNNSLNA